MPRFNNVKLLSSQGEHIRWLALKHALKLADTGIATIYQSDNGRLFAVLGLLNPDVVSYSPTTITDAESRANVGEHADPDFIEMAQRKVQQWDKEGLKRPGFYRAVTIVAGKVMRPNLGQEGL